MLWILGILLLVVPALEFWFSVRLGVHLGVVVVWCFLTGAVGVWFARRESLSLWTELESDVQNGRLPTIDGVDTMLVVLGGWGLIVPGLFTDALGAALLARPVRYAATDFIRRTIRIRLL